MYWLGVYALIATAVFLIAGVLILVLFVWFEVEAWLRLVASKARQPVTIRIPVAVPAHYPMEVQTMIRSIVSKKGTAGLVATIAVFSVLSTTAMAQVEQRSQVTVQGTALITKDTNGNSLSQHTTKSGGFLVGYSYQFNSWAGVEGNYGYTQNTLNTLGSLGRNSIRSDFHEVTGAFVAHIPTSFRGFKPYALAGAGALIFHPTDNAKSGNPGIDQQTKATFVYGGGVEFNVTNHFGFRAEYRGLVYKAPDFKLSSLNPDKITHLAQPSVGVYFRF